jgi:hypothetical protein
LRPERCRPSADKAQAPLARIRQMKHKSVEPEARFSYYSQ